MVFNTRSGRPVGSHWAAKRREPTARVEGAILFRSPERGYPVSGARARGLLSVAESALTTKVGSSTRGPPIAPCDPVPWYAWRPVEAGRSGGMHKGGGWASRGRMAEWPKVGLPSHSAPQPVLEASVVTTFLVWTNPMATPFSFHRGFFQGVRAFWECLFFWMARARPMLRP